MSAKKSKLIFKFAVSKWNEKNNADKQKWGHVIKNDALGLPVYNMETAFDRFHRHIKRGYAAGDFEIKWS